MNITNKLLPSLTLLLIILGTATAGAQTTTSTPPPAEKEAEPQDMFPGVRGISGDELQRRLAEFERRRQQAERQRRTTTPPSQPARTPADTAPAERPAQRPAQTNPDAQRPAQPAADRRRTNPDPAPAPAAQVQDVAKLPDEQRDYVRRLEQQVEHIEAVLVQADMVRRDAETEAATIDYEPRIQYYLRYQRSSAPQTRAYEQTLATPLLVYRYVVEQTTQVAKTAEPDKRPAELPQFAIRHIEKLLERNNEARRHSLLAAAELYTRIRQLAAAEVIYNYLLRHYSKDAAVIRSHAAFVAIRDEPKPSGPPSRPRLRFDERDRGDDDPDARRRRW